jgi:hypothetical protein
LHPLIGAGSERILSLRIVDPAMGSAAFLVTACRYLARAYERALLGEGTVHEADIDESDRAGFRRLIAQRCLFGVDLNSTAVQLARLSLWLATLSRNKPLTFLDHHLVCGNSLLGASPLDLARQPPGAGCRPMRRANVPLFADRDFEPSLAQAVAERRWLAETRDDTAEVVREKETRLTRLRSAAGWRSLADLWCACWMWPDPEHAPAPAVFASLADKLTTGRCGLPELSRPRSFRPMIVCAHRFFHWMFEFPEVCFDERASRSQTVASTRSSNLLGHAARRWSGKTFVRWSGVYRHRQRPHQSISKIFLERAVALARRDSRIGLVLPPGSRPITPRRRCARGCWRTRTSTPSAASTTAKRYSDSPQRRFLICDNEGRADAPIACRFGIDDASELETIPDTGDRPAAPSHPITLTPSFIAALDGEKLAIPELRTATDLRILERIVHDVPRLDAADGWSVKFGRELNATDDRIHFHSGGTGLPVLEGKHIEPFAVRVDRSTLRISERAAGRLLDAATTIARARLAYRDVASSTNRLSLIAACCRRAYHPTASSPENPLRRQSACARCQQLRGQLPGAPGRRRICWQPSKRYVRSCSTTRRRSSTSWTSPLQERTVTTALRYVQASGNVLRADRDDSHVLIVSAHRQSRASRGAERIPRPDAFEVG